MPDYRASERFTIISKNFLTFPRFPAASCRELQSSKEVPPKRREFNRANPYIKPRECSVELG
jgi:hypothetical protein